MSSIDLSVLSEVPPLWELDRFVAVQPFLGWTSSGWLDAMRALEEQWNHPIIPDDELAAPVSRSGGSHGSLPGAADDHLGPFLAAYFAAESAAWPMPWRDLPLFEAWRASLPGSLSLHGLDRRRVRAALAELPETAAELLEERSRSDAGFSERSRQLLTLLPGWASYLRRLSWPAAPGSDSPLAALLAMLWVLDTAIGPLPGADEAFHAHRPPDQSPPPIPSIESRQATLEERERGYREELYRRLSEPHRGAPAAPLIRAAFCIDVRSEQFRRRWEAVDPRVVTDGFAGFFGLAIDWEHQDGEHEELFPVLLSGEISASSKPAGPVTGGGSRWRSWKKEVSLAGMPTLSFAETLGWFSLFPTRRKRTESERYPGLEASVGALTRETRTAQARRLLTNLGWEAPWPAVNLLVGHQSASANNPHASSLDCGACGGRSGEANARWAAALLNDRETREELDAEGWEIPSEALFLAAVHNTTSDVVTICPQSVPAGQEKAAEQAAASLQAATPTAQSARLTSFPFLNRSSRRRARSRAETRPETGLAGNAGFIAAPREATYGTDLGGRSFLHSYDHDRDPDGSLLELILTAPVVVAAWINLQYFASSSAPSVYGAGNKVLHTQVGVHGVFEGNGHDLKFGLPWQSVAFSNRLYHEPLRLQVIVRAARTAIDRVMAGHPEFRELVDNGWMRLVAWEADGSFWLRAAGQWEVEQGPVPEAVHSSEGEGTWHH